MSLTFILSTLLFTGFVLQAIAIGIIQGAIAGVFFGIAMALVLGEMHRCGLRHRGFTPARQNLSVIHSKSIELSLPYEQVFDLCKEAIGSFPQAKIKQEDRSTGILVAHTKWTWESWGQKISFVLQAETDRITHVVFSSRPLVRTAIVDFGKNLMNMQRIQIRLQPYVTALQM